MPQLPPIAHAICLRCPSSPSAHGRLTAVYGRLSRPSVAALGGSPHSQLSITAVRHSSPSHLSVTHSQLAATSLCHGCPAQVPVTAICRRCRSRLASHLSTPTDGRICLSEQSVAAGSRGRLAQLSRTAVPADAGHSCPSLPFFHSGFLTIARRSSLPHLSHLPPHIRHSCFRTRPSRRFPQIPVSLPP
jgi:ribosomal protein L40E